MRAGESSQRAPRFPEGRVGLISDTHGLLRVEAIDYLKGCRLILHAGDIGGAEILSALSAIAPVVAVRGNNDTEPDMQFLRESEFVHVGDVLLLLIHDRAALETHLETRDADIIVTGHSHKPLLEYEGGILYVNPGSAGRRRFTLPIAIGELRIEGAGVAARIVNVLDGSPIASG